MPLFIFSSKLRLCLSLLVAVLVLAGYNAYLVVAKPKVTEYQNQWVDNYSVAEKFIYSDETPRIVLVGSSMTARLPDEPGGELENLSFHGGSALTGLKIIQKSNKLPAVILVETNVLERDINNDMIDDLFTPVVWKLKEELPSFHYTYQPINLLLSFLKEKYGASETKLRDSEINMEIFNMAVRGHLDNNSDTKPLTEAANRFDRVEAIVDDLKGKGVRVAFFQMPVYKPLLQSPCYRMRKEMILERFSSFPIYWIDEEQSENYKTTDGVHLTYASALVFSKRINEIAKSLSLSEK